MKKLLLTLVMMILFIGRAYADVMDVKWGVDNKGVLRLVVDLSESSNYDVEIENNVLKITMETPYSAGEKIDTIRSDYADSLHVKTTGNKTVVRVPLKQELTKEDLRIFTLKQDPVTNRPVRIVLDVAKRTPTVVVPKQETKPVVQAPVVSSVPQIRVGSSPSPVKPAPSVAVSSNPSVSQQTAAVSSQPLKIAAKPPMATAEQPRVTVGSQNAIQPSVTGSSSSKVMVGNSPTNKVAAQAQATQKGKDAVAEILGRASSSQQVQQEASKQEVSKSSVMHTENAPIITDSAPVNTGKTEVMPSAPSATTSIPSVVVVKPNQSVASVSEKKVEFEKNKNGEYRTKGGIKGKIITIDPGHGGSDPGAVSKKGTYEKTITLSMAKKLKADLVAMGAKVYLTRSTDIDVAGKNADDEAELQARVNIAEKNGSDLFISLHINASVNKKASGISTYYYPKTSYDNKLAKCIHKQLTSNFRLTDMGIREANFYVTKRCYMPAVLMELGFITNAKEEKTISGNWFQNKSMGLIADGIKDYFR